MAFHKRKNKTIHKRRRIGLKNRKTRRHKKIYKGGDGEQPKPTETNWFSAITDIFKPEKDNTQATQQQPQATQQPQSATLPATLGGHRRKKRKTIRRKKY